MVRFELATFTSHGQGSYRRRHCKKGVVSFTDSPQYASFKLKISNGIDRDVNRSQSHPTVRGWYMSRASFNEGAAWRRGSAICNIHFKIRCLPLNTTPPSNSGQFIFRDAQIYVLETVLIRAIFAPLLLRGLRGTR